MDSSSIELPGSEISTINFQDGCLRIHFSRAYIVKTMTGSQERTRWWQSGDLIMETAHLQSSFLPGPLVCEGGDIDDNLFTYRDMIPIPLESRGRIRCDLRFRGTDAHLVAGSDTLKLVMTDVPKYIEHIRHDH
jgi:hypothetical protein